MKSLAFILLAQLFSVNSKIKNHIVGGYDADIRSHPYAVFLSIECHGSLLWSCGGSVLNQKIVLTVAHCVDDCRKKPHGIKVWVGHSYPLKGHMENVRAFKSHEAFDMKTYINDISLLLLVNNLPYGVRVKRVALMKNPPYSDPAYIVGWGFRDEKNLVPAERLMYLDQTIWSPERCYEITERKKPGTFCAEYSKAEYTRIGDAGGALVTQKFVVLGLLSHRAAKRKSLAVYTDVGYFYNWIRNASANLYCNEDKV